MAIAPYATPGQRLAYWALRVYGALFCFYLVGPIFIFVPLSFNEQALFHYPIQDYSLRWYEELLNSPIWSKALANSLFVAVASTLAATALGVCAAVGMWTAAFRGRGLIMAVLLTPMIVPNIIVAVSLYFAFAQLGANNSYLGLILAHTALATPLVLVTVMATLARFDGTMLRAAASLGAGPLASFRWVTLPLILPGVMTGSIFAFAVSFDDVVVALFIAGPVQRTLPVQMYMATTDVLELTITAAATVMLMIAVGLMLIFELVKKRDQLAGHRNNYRAAG